MVRAIPILIVAFLYTIVVHGFDTSVDVHVWTKEGCGGSSTVYPHNHVCWNYPNYHESISAVSMDTGSCFTIFKELSCRGESRTIKYPNDLCTLPNDWRRNVYSSTDCSSRSVSVRCPSGTYVREIEYKDANQGMTVRCFNTTLSTPSYTKNTNDLTITNPHKTSCKVASSGISLNKDNKWKMYHVPNIKCGQVSVCQENSTPEAKCCPTNNGISAMTGVDVTIDEAGVIKDFGVACSKVPDPSTLCEPEESLRMIIQCDNTGSDNEMECSYSHTVGVGYSKTMSETERKESEFYDEFGYSITAGIPQLSVSMSRTLGNSELVGHEWSESDTSTWTEETTISATIKVRPRSHSKLEQLVGKCSFLGASVNYFRQTDVTPSGNTTVTYFKS